MTETLTYVSKSGPPQLRQLVRIDAGPRNFCAGLVVVDNIVIANAPILLWAKGKTLAHVRKYCRAKRWHVDVMGDCHG